MYQYGNYQLPQNQFEYNPYVQMDYYDPRQLSPILPQLPQWQQLERRVNQLERQNNQQDREIERIQRRMQRLNQRLRIVENRLNIPFTPFDGEF